MEYPIDDNRKSVLTEFLSLSDRSQLVWVKELTVSELLTLRGQLFGDIADGEACDADDREAWQEAFGEPVSNDTLAAILYRCEPEEYDGAWQDAGQQAALTPAALRKLRLDTYESQVRPLLHADAGFQERFVLSLARDDREALLRLLDRYAREFGRSARCRAAEDLIRSLLHRGVSR